MGFLRYFLGPYAFPGIPLSLGWVTFSGARIGSGQQGPESSEKKRRFRFQGQVAFSSYFHARNSLTEASQERITY